MDMNTGTVFGDLTVMRKDHGRRVRDGKGSYWKCVCTCNKIISVKDTDLTLGKQKSCKLAGRPCKQPKNELIKVDDIFKNHKVVMKIGVSGSIRKSYYMISCLSCGHRSEKRGDTLIEETFAECTCQSTEN